MPKTQRAKYFESIEKGTDEFFGSVSDPKVALLAIVEDKTAETKTVMVRPASRAEMTKWLDARVGKAITLPGASKTITVPARKRRTP